MQIIQSRRHFLASLSAAGTAGVLGTRASLGDEGPLETTTVRLRRDPSICVAPWYIAEDLLRAEGFTDIRYVIVQEGPPENQMLARGDIDFTLLFAGTFVNYLDAGFPIAAVAGLHVGCFELFAHEPIRTISDLKGRKIGISVLGAGKHIYLAIMAAHVGLDPHTDIEWVESSVDPLALFPMERFAEQKVDAFLGFPPEPQELRARKIGHVILNTTTEKPWSQYFCCMVVGNREFVHNHPVATKRVLRAVLKANDICAAEPERAAQQLVDREFTERYDYALETMTDIPYAQWREFDAEDSLRFYALRLHEVGMIKASPNALLAEGTDWRFLNELKRELKA
jgi:NitT/TauT family transport system substrate-binding protein